MSLRKANHRLPWGVLQERLLLLLAQRIGPSLDVIDLAGYREGQRVRELLVELCVTGGPSPTEVRGALLDLADAGLISAIDSTQILAVGACVDLTVRGLLAARKLDPDCGMPVGVVTLRMKGGRKAGLFDAAFDTGHAERDKLLNAAGLNLAAFYVLAVKRPTKAAPLLLSDCGPWFARLAHLGVGVKAGPGDRLCPSSESISKAFDRLRSVAPVCGTQGEDARQSAWFLNGPLPEVRVVNAKPPQFEDWSWMHYNLVLTLKGQPFSDRLHREVRPLTDQQLRAYEAKSSGDKGYEGLADAHGGGSA